MVGVWEGGMCERDISHCLVSLWPIIVKYNLFRLSFQSLSAKGFDNISAIYNLLLDHSSLQTRPVDVGPLPVVSVTEGSGSTGSIEGSSLGRRPSSPGGQLIPQVRFSLESEHTISQVRGPIYSSCIYQCNPFIIHYPQARVKLRVSGPGATFLKYCPLVNGF